MLYGMGTVFVFLTLLVICTMLMSAVVNRFLPEEAETALAGITDAGALSPKTIAIIQAAIHAHRAKHRK